MLQEDHQEQTDSALLQKAQQDQTNSALLHKAPVHIILPGGQTARTRAEKAPDSNLYLLSVVDLQKKKVLKKEGGGGSARYDHDHRCNGFF